MPEKRKDIVSLCTSPLFQASSVPVRAQLYSACPVLSPSLRKPANQTCRETQKWETLHECKHLCLRKQNAFVEIYILLEDIVKVPRTLIKGNK